MNTKLTSFFGGVRLQHNKLCLSLLCIPRTLTRSISVFCLLSALSAHSGTNAALVFRTNDYIILPTIVWAANSNAINAVVSGGGGGGVSGITNTSTNITLTGIFYPTNTGINTTFTPSNAPNIVTRTFNSDISGNTTIWLNSIPGGFPANVTGWILSITNGDNPLGIGLYTITNYNSTNGTINSSISTTWRTRTP